MTAARAVLDSRPCPCHICALAVRGEKRWPTPPRAGRGSVAAMKPEHETETKRLCVWTRNGRAERVFDDSYTPSRHGLGSPRACLSWDWGWLREWGWNREG
eukprot:2007271-Rhodomonas_salina.1